MVMGFQATGAGGTFAATTTALMVVVRMMVVVRDARRFIGQRHKRVALGAGITAARSFPQKEDHKRKHETEADGESERDDGHDGARV
jgi:hypothetical protein